MSWEEAWSEGRTGWDAGKGAPPLVELIGSGRLPKGRALVPGCGSGYDVFNLAEAGWEVDGLDVAPTAVERFKSLREERGISAEKAHITNADFFAYEADPYDLIFDYTFLCAIELERRHDWARKTASLLDDDGLLVTLVFPMGDGFEYEEGPPYRLSPDVVRGVALPYFTCVDVFRPSQSHEGREGREMVALWKKRVSQPTI